jgi:group I intron endonuclease
MDIYKITNKTTGKIYVGFSKDAIKRFKRHLQLAENGVNRRLYDSIRKHGRDSFELEIITKCDTKAEAIQLEKFWIIELNTLMPNGYNMTSGGDGGYTLGNWSEEAITALYKRQGNSRKGAVVTEATRRKISESNMGKTIPLEQRQRQSATLKRIGHKPPVMKGKVPWMAGKTHSEATKDKLSKARLGKSWEDLWDDNYIKERKDKLVIHFTGKNNPRYVEFSLKSKINILNSISSDISTNIKSLPSIFDVSEFKIRGLLREVGIDNFQVSKKEHRSDWFGFITTCASSLLKEGTDVSSILGVSLWEAPAEFISADAKGNFPSFIPKTSQERIQNCYRSIQTELQERLWEVTEKVHGQSMTVYFNQGEFGVCSRNLDLKDSDNTFWNTARKYNLQQKLSALGRNIAIQGEQYGVGINGNNYKLSGVELLVFNIYCIDTGTYLSTLQCRELSKELCLETVPVIHREFYAGDVTLDDILSNANGESVLAKTKREGFVFKSTTSDCSFKVVSNEWLLKNE